MTARIWYYNNGKFLELNKVLVSEGMAWVDRFSSNEELKNLELDARKNGRGLFSSPKPMPPWIFREKRDKIKYKVPSFSNCFGNSKPCKKMQSCREAKQYLDICGRTDLDPDRDGIPCENTVCFDIIKVGTTFDEENDD